MPIDLEKALRKKKLQTSGGEQYKYQTPGDQLVFRFHSLRTINKDNRQSFTIDCEFLGGEKIVDGKVTKVKPGRGFFYLQTDSKRIFDAEKPLPGDVWLLRLVAIRKELNGMKEYEYEVLERVPRPEKPTPSPSDDDIPNPAPKE